MTLAETGAYINLLASAWQSSDCGLPDDDGQLARLSGAFGEWEDVGTSVRSCFYAENGRIFNEKLLKELAYFTKQSVNGARGGRPKKPKRNPNETQTITQTITQTKASQKLRSSEAQISEAQNKPPSSSAMMDDGAFDAFWKAYPRKVGKLASRKAWRKLKLDSKSNEVLQAIIRCKDSEQWRKGGGQFIPHPATFLNRGGWDDNPEPASRQSVGTTINAHSCPKCYDVGAVNVNTLWTRCDCAKGKGLTQDDLDRANDKKITT